MSQLYNLGFSSKLFPQSGLLYTDSWAEQINKVTQTLMSCSSALSVTTPSAPQHILFKNISLVVGLYFKCFFLTQSKVYVQCDGWTICEKRSTFIAWAFLWNISSMSSASLFTRRSPSISCTRTARSNSLYFWKKTTCNSCHSNLHAKRHDLRLVPAYSNISQAKQGSTPFWETGELNKVVSLSKPEF